MTKRLIYHLNKKSLSERKKAEIRVFADLRLYQELMSRPYFIYLKRKITDQLKRYRFVDKKILEVGAGISQFLKLFEDNNHVVALDINAELLKQNKTKAKLVVADAETLPFKDQSFDFIYMIGVLHHLPDQRKALLEAKRVLKMNGQIFIVEPTKWSLNLPYYLLRQFALIFFGEKYYRNISGCGTTEESFVSIGDVKEVFDPDFNLKFEKILPLRMPPIAFLENLFPKGLNRFLEKIPLINYFGTIIFVHAKRR